jgi:hypothetical protein
LSTLIISIGSPDKPSIPKKSGRAAIEKKLRAIENLNNHSLAGTKKKLMLGMVAIAEPPYNAHHTTLSTTHKRSENLLVK